jgi:hypothetical protein
LTTAAAFPMAIPAAWSESLPTRIGDLDMEASYPSDATITKLHGERDFPRARQAYLWALPIVGMAYRQKASPQRERSIYQISVA